MIETHWRTFKQNTVQIFLFVDEKTKTIANVHTRVRIKRA